VEIEGKNVLVLGAYGEAGIAICRQILRYRPEIVIDCINTATALSYQNIYHAYEARNSGGTDQTDAAAVLYQLLSATRSSTNR